MENNRIVEEIPVLKAGTMRRKGPSARLLVLYLAAILLLAAFVTFDSRPEHNQFLGELYEFRHVLLLGFGGLMFLELTALLGRRWIRKRSLYYAAAGAIVLLASIRIEFSHLPWETERLVRNFCGGVAFLLMSAAFDRPLRREHDRLRGRARKLLAGISALILLSILHPLAPVALAYAGRSGSFPVVVEFTENWQHTFATSRDAMLFTGPAPWEWESRRDKLTAMISFDPVAGAGVTASEVYPDWSGFNWIRFQVWSEDRQPRQLVLEIDDQKKSVEPDKRYRRMLQVRQGLNDFEIPLTEVRTGPEAGEMKMRKIRHIEISSPGATERFRLFFSDFRLVEQPVNPAHRLPATE
ncbi:MAG: hypothetical protein PVG91_06815 [Gammaproteobacteria bacterium]|jgi:hypothetical protein